MIPTFAIFEFLVYCRPIISLILHIQGVCLMTCVTCLDMPYVPYVHNKIDVPYVLYLPYVPNKIDVLYVPKNFGNCKNDL